MDCLTLNLMEWYREDKDERREMRKKEITESGWKVSHVMSFVGEPILFIMTIVYMLFVFPVDLVFLVFIRIPQWIGKLGNLPLNPKRNQ